MSFMFLHLTPWFCTHLPPAGVHHLRQLTGRLVHKDIWVQIHSSASGGGQSATRWGKWREAGLVPERRASLVGWACGSWVQIKRMDLVDWRRAYWASWSPVISLNHLVEVRVAQFLKTKKTGDMGESMKTVNVNGLTSHQRTFVVLVHWVKSV